MKLWEGNVFTGVCQSFCSQIGGGGWEEVSLVRPMSFSEDGYVQDSGTPPIHGPGVLQDTIDK